MQCLSNLLVNLALGQPTRQSSTAYGAGGNRAVDGNINQSWGGNSCTLTNDGPGPKPWPWWDVSFLSLSLPKNLIQHFFLCLVIY